MRRAWLLAAAAIGASVSIAAAQTPAPAKPAAVTGKWTLTLQAEAFTATTPIEMKQDGEKLAGTYHSTRYGPSPLEGKIKDRAIQFAVKLNAEGTEIQMAFSGEVAADGQTMKGQVSIGEMGDATWTAKKEK